MADENTSGAGPALPDAFAAIANQAAAVDSQADEVLTGPKPANQAPVEVIDPAEAWAEIPAMVGMILGTALPEVRPAYSPDNCYAWGKAMHRVAMKRGWSGEGLPPEASALLASAMFVIPTLAAIKARQRAAEDARQARAAGGAAAGVLSEITGIQDGHQAGG